MFEIWNALLRTVESSCQLHSRLLFPRPVQAVGVAWRTATLNCGAACKCVKCPTDVWWKMDDGMDGAVIQAVLMLLTLWQHLGKDKTTTINTWSDVGSMAVTMLMVTVLWIQFTCSDWNVLSQTNQREGEPSIWLGVHVPRGTQPPRCLPGQAFQVSPAGTRPWGKRKTF